MPAPRLNWDAIKAEYIAGDDSVTHQFLADKYHCARAVVTRHAKGWQAARSQYRSQMVAKTLNRVSTTEAELRAKQLRVAEYVLGKGLSALQKLDPTTYSEALRTVETALEQARKAAGIADRHEVSMDISESDLMSMSDDQLRALLHAERPANPSTS